MLLLVTLIALCVCTLGGAVRDNVLLGDDPLPKNMLSTTNPQYRTDGSKREQVSLITCDFPLSLLSTSALPIPPDRYPKMHLNHPNAICIQVRPPIQKSAKTKGTYLWIRHKDASMSPGDLRYCLWIFTVKPYGDKLGSSSKFFEPCGAEYNLHVRGHAIISNANNVGNQIDRVGVYSIQDDSAALYHHLKRTGMGHFHIIRVADFRIAKSHSGADVTAEHVRTLEMDLFGTLRGSGSAVMDGTGDEGVTTGGDVPVQGSGEPGGTGARSTGTADRTSSAQDRGAAPETAPNKSSKHNPFRKMLSTVKNAQNLAAIQLTWSLGQEQKDFNFTLPEFKCNESNTTFHITTGRKKTSMQTHVSLQDVRDLEAFTLLHLFGTIVVPRSSPATDATSAPNNTVPGDETQQGANTNSDKNMSDEDLSVQKDDPRMLRIEFDFYDVDVQTFKRHKPGSSSPQPWNHTSMLFQVRCTESGNPIGLRCVESAAHTVCHFHLFMELPENSSSMVITLYTYGVPFELHDFSVAAIAETRGDRNIFRDISARRGIERRYAAHMRRCSAMKRKAFSVLHALRTVGDQDSSARGAPRQSTARQRLEDLVQRHSVLIKHPDNAAPSAPDTKETDVSSIIDQLSRATLSTAALIQSLQGNLRERAVGLWHKGTDLTVHHAVGTGAASNLRLCSSALTKKLASMQRSCSTLLEPLREATENLLKLFVAGRERFGFVGRYGSPSIPASGRVVEAPDAVHSELVDLAERHARIARRAADLTAHVASLEQLVAAGRGGASQGRGLAIRRTLSGVLSAVGTAALCVVVIIALFGRRLRRMRYSK